jgi:hypothetical protein
MLFYTIFKYILVPCISLLNHQIYNTLLRKAKPLVIISMLLFRIITTLIVIVRFGLENRAPFLNSRRPSLGKRLRASYRNWAASRPKNEASTDLARSSKIRASKVRMIKIKCFLKNSVYYYNHQRHPSRPNKYCTNSCCNCIFLLKCKFCYLFF